MTVPIDGMLQEAVALHQSGKLAEAREMYETILRQDERNPNALNLLGMVHHAQGRQEHAAELVARAIEVAPSIPGFHNNLGTIRLAQRRPSEAENALRCAIELQADYVEAINNLGVSLMGQGKMDEAIPILLRAIELRPGYASARNNLGNVLRFKQMHREAIACYRDAIALKDDHPDAWANMAITMLEMRDLAGAEEACRTAISIRPDAVGPFYTLGLIMEETGRRDEAIEQYRGVLRQRPGADGVRFQLAALTGEQLFEAAPPEFVASLFDHYADTFDRHLVDKLGYRAPQLLHEAVTVAHVRGPVDVADLGCGTGLCGPLFRPMARSLIGVDLSSRMIGQARNRGVYDELAVDEITAFLAARRERFDLAIAADVLLYFGDLSGVLAGVTGALRPGGTFAFTLEKHDGKGYVLQPTRRFAHSIEYVRSLLAAAALREIATTEGVLRNENEQNVPGWVIVLRKDAG